MENLDLRQLNRHFSRIGDVVSTAVREAAQQDILGKVYESPYPSQAPFGVLAFANSSAVVYTYSDDTVKRFAQHWGSQGKMHLLFNARIFSNISGQLREITSLLHKPGESSVRPIDLTALCTLAAELAVTPVKDISIATTRYATPFDPTLPEAEKANKLLSLIGKPFPGLSPLSDDESAFGGPN